ncbi:MAG: hypothetical protein LC650_01915 [Actinobacteria bacterium]|nr:hypothetical protein [Actinomycetota bacterium]
MTTITIILFGVAVAGLILVASRLYGKDRAEPWLFGAGTVLLLLIGLSMLLSPLETTTGYNVDKDNATFEVVTYTTTPDSSLVNYSAAMVFILVGMYGSITAVRKIRFGDDGVEDYIEFE